MFAEGAGAVSVKAEAGAALAAALGKNKAVIHKNHGLITVSRHSIDEAAFWFIALDRCCRVQLDVEACKEEPVMVAEDLARFTREQVGSPFIGWLHFQPIFSQIAASQPDMYD